MSEHARLYVVGGPEVGRSFAIGPRAVIGRGSECDVRLRGTTISRRHARVERTRAGWSVLDLGSTNGVHKDGRRVERATLADRDELLLGDVRLRFRLAAEPGEEPGRREWGGLRSRAARRELSGAPRGAGFFTAALDQRPWWVQLFLVGSALLAAAMLARSAFLLVRTLRGLSGQP